MNEGSGGQIYRFDLGDGHNALSPAVLEAFTRVLDEIESADGARALVTSASGEVWSNGLDLAWMMEDSGDVPSLRADRGYWCLPEVDLGMFLLPGEQGEVTAKLPAAAPKGGSGTRLVVVDIVRHADDASLERIQVNLEDGWSTMEMWALISLDEHGIVTIDNYDIDDADAAHTRFDELTTTGAVTP